MRDERDGVGGGGMVPSDAHHQALLPQRRRRRRRHRRLHPRGTLYRLCGLWLFGAVIQFAPPSLISSPSTRSRRRPMFCATMEDSSGRVPPHRTPELHQLPAWLPAAAPTLPRESTGRRCGNPHGACTQHPYIHPPSSDVHSVQLPPLNSEHD